MNDITFEDLNLKEQLFVQNYLLNVNVAESAFIAGYCNIEDKKKYSDITRSDYINLNKAGNRVLKKDYIKKIICVETKKIVKKNNGADCREVILYLTDIIRLSKNNLTNMRLLNQGLRAAALLLTRFPIENNPNDDEIIFCTGIDEKGDIIK